MTRPAFRDPLLRDAAAIGIAVGAFGASYGALAVASGLSAAQAVATSLLVFTGASQFAFIGVLAAGGGALAAILPAALLAVRNGLYGLTLEYLLPAGLRRRLAVSHLIIDESTAMARAQADAARGRRALIATGIAVFVCWNLGTLAGAASGGIIGDPSRLGLDAMFPAAFLALLAPQLRRPQAGRIACAGAIAAALLVPVAPAGVPILGASLAVLLPRWGRP